MVDAAVVWTMTYGRTVVDVSAVSRATMSTRSVGSCIAAMSGTTMSAGINVAVTATVVTAAWVAATVVTAAWVAAAVVTAAWVAAAVVTTAWVAAAVVTAAWVAAAWVATTWVTTTWLIATAWVGAWVGVWAIVSCLALPCSAITARGCLWCAALNLRRATRMCLM